MSYRTSGIDVHKKVLAVVVSDVEIENEYRFERRMFRSNPEQLGSPAAFSLIRTDKTTNIGFDIREKSY